MKKTTIVLALMLAAGSLFAQRKTTTSATVSFDATTSLDALPKAENKTVIGAIDTQTGSVHFEATVKNFSFSNPTMQQHFNENYVESDKYPKSEFKGTITNNSAINYKKDGTYAAKIKGQLTMHGVTKDVETTGSLKINGGKIDATSTFNVLISDYNIKIAPIVKEKVSDAIKITVDCNLEPLKS